MRAVSNTSPLFNLAAIDQLHLLRQTFTEVPTQLFKSSSPPASTLRCT